MASFTGGAVAAAGELTEPADELSDGSAWSTDRSAKTSDDSTGTSWNSANRRPSPPGFCRLFGRSVLVCFVAIAFVSLVSRLYLSISVWVVLGLYWDYACDNDLLNSGARAWLLAQSIGVPVCYGCASTALVLLPNSKEPSFSRLIQWEPGQVSIAVCSIVILTAEAIGFVWGLFLLEAHRLGPVACYPADQDPEGPDGAVFDIWNTVLATAVMVGFGLATAAWSLAFSAVLALFRIDLKREAALLTRQF